MDILKVTNNYNALDHWDKIYTLLNICNMSIKVQPNYAQSVEEVYTSIFCSLILEDQGLDQFLWLTGEHNNLTQRGLASWVPNLQQQKLAKFIATEVEQNIKESRLYLASSPNRSQCNSTVHFINRGLITLLKGIAVNKISQLGDSAPSQGEVLLNSKSCEDIFLSWMGFFKEAWNTRYLTGGTMEDAF